MLSKRRENVLLGVCGGGKSNLASERSWYLMQAPMHGEQSKQQQNDSVGGVEGEERLSLYEEEV